MRLGLNTGQFGPQLRINMDLIQEAESLGFDSCWTAEAYGNDAIVPLTWIAAKTSRIKLGTAIMQVPGRTPAMTAMQALSLDALRGGRFVLGLGPSGRPGGEGGGRVALREACGLLDGGLVAAHCLLLGEADVALVGAAGITVGHAPVGNARAGDMAPVLAA